MSPNGRKELIETLDEIGSILSALSPDLTDKKAISDIMLALEKVLPEVRASFNGKLAWMCETLAQLYEKFLMEMVEDASTGIESAREGVKVFQEAFSGKGDMAALEARAVEVVRAIKDAYQVCASGFDPCSIPAPASAAPNGDDDFFASLDAQPPHEPFHGDNNSTAAANPVAEKLSRIANDVTMLDADMTDKKSVSDIMMEFEQVHGAMLMEKKERSIADVAGALGKLYEKSLMEGLADGQRAVDLTTDGIMILSACYEPVYPEDLADQARGVLRKLADLFGVTPPEAAQTTTGVPVPEKGQTAAPPPPPAPAPSAAAPKGARAAVTPLEPEILKIASDEDLLIYSEFVAEVGDATQNIEADLLELEGDPTDAEIINNLFRAYHSMKGAAGFLGVNTINVICHEAETLLDRFRKKTLVCNQEMIDALLRAVDVVKAVNEGLSVNCQKAKAGMPNANLEIPKFAIEGLVAVLSDLAERPQAEPGEEEERELPALGEMLVREGKVSEEELALALQAQEKRKLGEILVDMGAVDKDTVEGALARQEDKKKKVSATSLKIDTEKLDTLLELVGELVISQSIVTQESYTLEEANRGLFKNIINLGKITKNIQDQVMTLRMVPLKQTFQKMSRLVRDLSKKVRKPANLHLSGEDTEIDKTLIEELNDPLVHLLRNSMDHGIEPPEEREAKGKPRAGDIWLVAYHRGGNVHIEVRDDGKGLDREKVRKKALEKGLITGDQELTDAEIYNLILLPGFSTHDVATEISGRGVGMDVVRSNIDRLGGRLEISSVAGRGSTFTVRLPLTMAIVDGMIVRIGHDRFVIPTISIRESIRPRREEISTFRKQGEMLDVRGKLLPLIRLHEFLGVVDAEHHNPWEGLVIIVESDDKEFGFMVDDLLGQQQVVIKSLDRRFKGLPGISGGTILGDGHVGLILDVSGVVAAI